MRALLGGLAGLLLLATPAWAADEGERLFIQKGCIGCHGVGGPDRTWRIRRCPLISCASR